MVSRLRQVTVGAASADPGVGLHLGKVTRVTATGAFVELRALAAGYEYGPCRYPADMAPDAETLTAGSHSHSIPGGSTGTSGDHRHDLRALAAGDTVLCGFLAGGRDDLVVIVRLT